MFLAVISSFSLPNISLAADYQVAIFPALASWTVANSDTNEFVMKQPQLDLNGWDPSYLPFTSSFTQDKDTIIYSDDSAGFYRGKQYMFLANKNNLVFDLNDSTLRVLIETDRYPSAPETWPVGIQVEQGSQIRFTGESQSALQFKTHGMRFAYVAPEAHLGISAGDVWFQFATDVGNPGYLLQIQGKSDGGSKVGSVSINAVNDIVLLADTELTGKIPYVIQSSGSLALDAKRIFIGVENTDHSIAGDQLNRLLSLGGQALIGSESTELIALNGARVGLEITPNIDEFILKTNNLQIIGDGHQNSKAVVIEGNLQNPESFYAKDAYIADVSTGIQINGGAATMKFGNLWNLAAGNSLKVESGDLILSVGDTALFKHEIYANDGNLTFDGANYVVDDIIYLTKGSRLSGTAKILQVKQIVANNCSFVNLPATSFIVGTNEKNLDYALSISEGSTVNLNANKSSNTIVQIENDVQVSDRGVFNANFTNSNSYVIGTVRNLNENMDSQKVSMSFENGAFWRVTSANNQAVDLSLNSANIYLNQTAEGEHKKLTRDNSVELTLSKLSGENGVFYMSTSLEDVYGDSIKIEEGSGKHQLMLASSGSEPKNEALSRALVTEINGSLELSLANEGGKVDLGNYVYDLISRQTDSATEWFLSNNSLEPEPNPEPDPTPEPQPELSPSATAVLALAGSGSQTTQFLYGLSDLRKRMGDLRYGASDGLYASIRGGKDRISGFSSTSYKNEYAALSIGYDRRVNDNWILGFSFEAIEGEQTVKNNGYNADGENTTQSLKAYATWFNSIGCYADFVISINRFDQDISTHMLDGSKVKGDFNSYGYGASAEIGKKFTLSSDETWYVEPQTQLAYYRVQGKDFSLNNGMNVHQENAHSLTGRLGVAVGRTILESNGVGYQFSLRAGVNHEFLGDADIHVNGERFTTDSLGTRAYYGFGADWYLSDNVRLYGHIEREKGARFTSEINAKVGVKYHF